MGSEERPSMTVSELPFPKELSGGNAKHLYLLADVPLAFQSSLCSHQGFPASLPRTHDPRGGVVYWVGLGSPEDLTPLIHDTQMFYVLGKRHEESGHQYGEAVIWCFCLLILCHAS